MEASLITRLRERYGNRLQENVLLSGVTSARVGGPADVALIAKSAAELEEVVRYAWELDLPYLLLGAGSNVLASDRGFRGLLIINRARAVQFTGKNDDPGVIAESGATLNDLAQKASRLGLSGLEWASAIPGSLGGALYGNAGAFGGDMAALLASIDLLHRQQGHLTWQVEQMEYTYRSSTLKRSKMPAIILSAALSLSKSSPEAVQSRRHEISLQRRRLQPPGASMGSIFKNPTGDSAGRLIEAAGLKGKRIGNAEISLQHANFLINHGDARAMHIRQLIDASRQEILTKFGLELELEIEMVGDW